MFVCDITTAASHFTTPLASPLDLKPYRLDLIGRRAKDGSTLDVVPPRRMTGRAAVLAG
jgi:hypothetical protein